MFLFDFVSLLLIFTLVTASISHFLTAPNKIFMFLFQQNWLPSGLSLALALALLSASRYTLKFSGKEDSGGGTQIRCCFFFSLPKSQGGHADYHRKALSYMKRWTYVRTIFSEIKFLGCIDNKIFLLKVLRFAHLKRESEADDNNNINNSNNNSNYSNNNNNK